MKTILGIIALFTLYSCGSQPITGNSDPAESVESMLKNRRFVFEAVSMMPQKGRSEFLSGGYHISVRNDTLQSELPFKGESTQPPMTRDEAGYFFTSTRFNYILSNPKEGSWHLKMEVDDHKFTRFMELQVFSNGKADLGVYSNFRDQIHFSGNLVPIKQ